MKNKQIKDMNPAREAIKSRPGSAITRWQERLKSVPVQPRSSTPNERTGRPTPERPRTVAEAAGELGLSVYTVRAWIASRRLAHLRLGRAIRIPAAELRRAIEASTVPAERE